MSSPKVNTILLLSGYCGTGKDTLFTSLHQTKPIESLGYSVYSKNGDYKELSQLWSPSNNLTNNIACNNPLGDFYSYQSTGTSGIGNKFHNITASSNGWPKYNINYIDWKKAVAYDVACFLKVIQDNNLKINEIVGVVGHMNSKL
jgi:hypothetical protein